MVAVILDVADALDVQAALAQVDLVAEVMLVVVLAAVLVVLVQVAVENVQMLVLDAIPIAQLHAAIVPVHVKLVAKVADLLALEDVLKLVLVALVVQSVQAVAGVPDVLVHA